MPPPRVYQSLEPVVADVPRPSLAPDVHAEAMPGAPGAVAAFAGTPSATKVAHASRTDHLVSRMNQPC